jgi:hypothetical protein
MADMFRPEKTKSSILFGGVGVQSHRMTFLPHATRFHDLQSHLSSFENELLLRRRRRFDRVGD